MKWTIVLIAALALGAAACGGGNTKSDRVLHMKGFDTTESAMRLQVRVILTDSAAPALCRSIQGLSAEDTVKVIDASPDEIGPTSTPFPAQTAVPGQTASPGDKLRVGNMLMEECSRILNGE